MFRNYLKSALRNFNRYRGYSLLNIAGLSLGLVASLLMGLWVVDELQYDRFHDGGDRIFQVMNNMGYSGEKIETWTGSPAPYYRIFADDLPEVASSMALFEDNRTFKARNGDVYHENGIIAAPNLFHFFSLPLATGDTSSLFSAPQQIAISSDLALTLFGSDWQISRSALGQSVELKGVGDFTVTAVFEKIPRQSTLQFDYVLSLEDYFTLEPEAREHYGNFYFQTFLKLKPGTNAASVSPKLAAVVNEHSQRDYKESDIFLHAFEDRYLHSKFENGQAAGGRIEYVRLFTVAAIFILLIACINYMNLVTARATRRSREIGIRKVSGATRRMVFNQFMTESILTTLICCVIAMAAAQLLIPFFNEITGKAIVIHYASPLFWLGILSLGVVTGLLAGSYPSVALSSFRVTNILKGQVVKGFNDISLRRGLVILQFVLSITLLIGALVVRSQIQYINNKNLGLDKDNVLMLRLPDALAAQEKYALLKDELGKLDEIAGLTAGSDNPLSVGSATGDPEWEGFSEDKRQVFNVLNIDHDFVETMRIPMAVGEDFSEEMLRDTVSRKYLLNEAAALSMGLDDPLGKKLKFWGDEGRIVGVVRDFHIGSLHQPIQPLILRLDNDWVSMALIRPSPGKTSEAISSVESLLARLAPGAEFDYDFMDQSYAAMYQAEQTTGRLANLFAIAALLISCLGLLGLTAFTAELRTKEIGVRKVLGASVADLVWLLNRELSLLLVVAFALATPLAWYVLRNWLESFAYHINLNAWLFVAAAGLILLVAVVTVSFHSFRVANANPAKSLKYE